MDNILQIKEKVRQFIINTSYISTTEINDDTLIFEQGIMDSMGFMSLISFIEESYFLPIKDDELLETNFESIEAITNYIAHKIAYQKVGQLD